MSTIPSPPSCRSCEHYVSSAEALAAGIGGVCAVHLVPVQLDDSCSQHEAKYLPDNNTVLVERQCVTCEHVNLYALGFGGTDWCAAERNHA